MAKNKATIETKTIKVEGEDNVSHANGLVRDAAQMIRPAGHTYLGSVTIHYYKSDLALKPTFEIRNQIMIANVEEGLADFGLKMLKTAMMNAFGREQPKTRS